MPKYRFIDHSYFPKAIKVKYKEEFRKKSIFSPGNLLTIQNHQFLVIQMKEQYFKA